MAPHAHARHAHTHTRVTPPPGSRQQPIERLFVERLYPLHLFDERPFGPAVSNARSVTPVTGDVGHTERPFGTAQSNARSVTPATL